MYADQIATCDVPLMNFKNTFREVTAALSRNWVRSAFTILGISVGEGAFICVVAIGMQAAA